MNHTPKFTNRNIRKFLKKSYTLLLVSFLLLSANYCSAQSFFKDVPSIDSLAVIQYQNGNYSQAAKLYTNAIKILEEYYADTLENSYFLITTIADFRELLAGVYYKRALCRSNLGDLNGVVIDCEKAEKYTIVNYGPILYKKCLSRIQDGQDIGITCQELTLAYDLGVYEAYELKKQVCDLDSELKSYETLGYENYSPQKKAIIQNNLESLQKALNLKEWDKIIYYGESLIKEGYNNSGLYNNIGWAYLLKENPAKAEVYLLKGLEYDKSDLYIWCNLAHAYLLQLKINEAYNIYMKFNSLSLANKTTWTSMVIDDFTVFTSAGIHIPYMQTILNAIK
jgi:tetratricopeptide (TPR) repeat protein